MADSLFSSVAEQLLADLRQEGTLVDLMISGWIEYRWAVDPEERDIAKAIIYNAFETYAVSRGMSLTQAEAFCEDHLEALIRAIETALG